MIIEIVDKEAEKLLHTTESDGSVPSVGDLFYFSDRTYRVLGVEWGISKDKKDYNKLRAAILVCELPERKRH